MAGPQGAATSRHRTSVGPEEAERGQRRDEMKAKPVAPASKISSSTRRHLFLTIHESSRPITEPRLGASAGRRPFAGTSLLTPDQTGKFRFASADRQISRRPHAGRRTAPTAFRRRRRAPPPSVGIVRPPPTPPLATRLRRLTRPRATSPRSSPQDFLRRCSTRRQLAQRARSSLVRTVSMNSAQDTSSRDVAAKCATASSSGRGQRTID